MKTPADNVLESSPESSTPLESVLPVVGIGASAGGLEAFAQLLTQLPQKSGMAFVLIQHLEPTHESRLADILSKSTSLPVTEVAEGMPVEPDHVYVIPPNTNMALSNGVLRLTPRSEARGTHLPIDFFLRSLAQDRHRHALGVVLSGTGTDGTLGLAEIKAAGGITFAQDEQSAKFPAMPLSAARDGMVDVVLPPGEIGRELGRIGGHAYLGQAADVTGAPFAGADKDFTRIIAMLYASSGVDFSHYRDTTLKRRILRRMALGKREALSDYVRQLETDEVEAKALYQDILIHVTRFFRDPKVFEALSATILPQIQAAKTHGDTIRVWVAGCATGEEAYSIAIALCEFQDTQETRYPVRIFASDISESPSLERARAGVYLENIEHDVSPERLRRFFQKEDSGYRIRKEIRELCVFAKHDVTADPPFANLDLISCRNVLIYLSAPLQRRIIPTFHYALNPSGFLLLGTSESIGRDTDLFREIDPQLKIYSKKMTAVRLPALVTKGAATGIRGKVGRVSRSVSPHDFQQAADRLMIRKFVPPGVLVNKDMDVIQFRGRTSPFLEPPQGGGAALNLAKMAQESISLEMRNAIRECEKTGSSVMKTGVRILEGRQIREANLEVIPIRVPDAPEACFLVLFEEIAASDLPALATSPQRGPPQDEEISLLRLELAAAREYLQTIREQCEAVNEELKSSNEEMVSSNEELQSTNEELETAKEELQSANEELATMNEELRTRNLQQAQLNDDLSNILTGVKLPILMLGKDLRIRRFTLPAGKILRLTSTDIGRPIGNVRLPVADFDFEKFVTEAVASEKPAEKEIRDQDGRWHSLRIHPYLSSDDKIDGAVVVLLDIDAVKRSEQRLQESGDFARSIVDTVREPLLILDENLRIRSANLSYYRFFGTRPQDTEGGLLSEVAGGRWRIPELLALLEKMPDSDVAEGPGFECFEMNCDVPSGRKILILNARRLLQDDGRKRMTLLAIEDVTDRRRAERDLRLLKFFSDQSFDPYYLTDRSGRISYVNRSACERLAYGESELLAMGIFQIEPACTSESFAALFERAHAGPVPPFEAEHAAKGGERFPVECSVTGVSFEGDDLMLVVARDITERKRVAVALQESEENLRQSQRMEAIGKLAGGVAHDFNNLLTAINGYSLLCMDKVPPEGELHQNLEEIHKAGERAASLTRQLLAYSRKQVLTAKVLDLNGIVSNMHNMLSRLVGEHIQLELSLEKPLRRVKADQGQMEQVLVNLVVNARDAMPHGGRITLKTGHKKIKVKNVKSVPPIPPGPYVVLTVTDSGVGMDAELLKRIFDPFFTTKGLGKGTGLGLSVVQGIISQSDGYIVVESEPEKGSEFRIYLPCENSIESAPAPSADALRPVGTETVLLVEDEETVRSFARKILEGHGYRVLEANNGRSALLVGEQHKDITIQILVTDMVMPGMGGRELAEQFLHSRPESRVLFMSGYTEDSMFGGDGLARRDVRFIQKPFSPAGLAKAVRETLDNTLQPSDLSKEQDHQN